MSGVSPRHDDSSGSGADASGHAHANGGETTDEASPGSEPSRATRSRSTRAAVPQRGSPEGRPSPPPNPGQLTTTSPKASSSPPPREGWKKCNLCDNHFPKNHFRILSGGRVASYCPPCSSIITRGRTRRLDIRSLRRAFHDGTLNELLGRDEPIPEDSKRCQLCTQVKNLSNFRLLPRGGHESYCRDCNRLVRRGVKKGKKIEEVRQAYEEGRIEDLLGAGSSVKPPTPEPVKPGNKRCNLCQRERELDQFAFTGKGRSSYCKDCDKYVRRGRQLKMSIEDIRKAYHDGNISEITPPSATPARAQRVVHKAPEGKKVCNLCEVAKALSDFMLKTDGGMYSYCLDCQKLVGRGRRRGLGMETMRKEYHKGALEHLLDAAPVVAQGSAADASISGEGEPEGAKKCNFCRIQKALSHFKRMKGNKLSAYCKDCDKVVGRGRRKGYGVDEIREAYANGTLAALLGLEGQDLGLPPYLAGDATGMDASTPSDPTGSGALGPSSGQPQAPRRATGSSSRVLGPPGPPIQPLPSSGHVSGITPVLGPERCKKCGNVFVPNIEGETLCGRCAGFGPGSAHEAGLPLALDPGPPPARTRRKGETGTSTVGAGTCAGAGTSATAGTSAAAGVSSGAEAPIGAVTETAAGPVPKGAAVAAGTAIFASVAAAGAAVLTPGEQPPPSLHLPSAAGAQKRQAEAGEPEAQPKRKRAEPSTEEQPDEQKKEDSSATLSFD